MLLNKSAQAFTWSVERLFEQSEKVYFWTFTFITTPYNDEWAMKQWNVFHVRLRYHFPDIKGLRVCELHRSHGIHFHALLNMRVPIRVMQKIWHGTGFLTGRNHYLDFGRVSVDEADIGSASYLTKYMTKQYREDNYFGRRRRWGSIGGFEQNRKNDIEVISQATENRKLLFNSCRCTYAQLMMIQHYTNLWGCVTEWPVECRSLVLRQEANFNRWAKPAIQKQNEALYIKTVADLEKYQETSDFKIERTGKTWDALIAAPSGWRGGEGLVGPEPWCGETHFIEDCNNSMADNEPF